MTYDVIDDLGASVPQAANITITGINDAPQVAATLLATTVEDGASFNINLLDGAFDIDAGETETLSIANVNGLTGGVTLAGTTLLVDPSHAAFQSLRIGDSQTITVTYDIIDVFGGVVPQTAAITIAGVNDAPQVTALVESIHEDNYTFYFNLLASAFDEDSLLNVQGADQSILTSDGRTLLEGVDYTYSRAGLSFTLTAVGSSQFNALADGETDSFTVNYEVFDGHTAVGNTLDVTVYGADEPSGEVGLFFRF